MVLLLLVLWSLVSLVVIVVWSTSPDLRGSSQCRALLAQREEQLEGAKVVWSKDKEALEEQVEEQRQEKERQGVHLLLLRVKLNQTEEVLQECRQAEVSEGGAGGGGWIRRIWGEQGEVEEVKKLL